MLTRGQILDQALENAGRTDSTMKGLARTWLNLFLQKQYNQMDWKWLEKVSAGLSISTSGTTLPDDYRAAISFTLIDSNGNRLPDKVDIVGPEEFEHIKQVGAVGTPRKALIDMLNRKMHVWPVPATAMTFDLRYYYLPEYLETLAADDNDEVVWGASEDILVQAVYVAALKHLDDARYQDERKELRDMLIEEKMNARDQRAGKSSMPLGRAFKNRFRNT